jgi:hypothetical protein
VHRTRAYPGEHGAIIDGATWDKIQPIPAESPRHGASRTRAVKPAVLKGLIFRPDKAMAPRHTRRRGRLYRFYLTATSLRLCHGEFPIRAVPAGEVESAVVNQIRTLLRSPELVRRVWWAAHRDGEAIDKHEVVRALQRLDRLWDQLRAGAHPAAAGGAGDGQTGRPEDQAAGRGDRERGGGSPAAHHRPAGRVTEVKLSPDGSTITLFMPHGVAPARSAWRGCL